MDKLTELTPYERFILAQTIVILESNYYRLTEINPAVLKEHQNLVRKIFPKMFGG